MIMIMLINETMIQGGVVKMETSDTMSPDKKAATGRTPGGGSSPDTEQVEGLKLNGVLLSFS